MIARDHPSSSSCIEDDDAGHAGQGYIEHHVSKLDTLAGIAIKYGIEVADVKRANGLATDLQMFAHKTLKIPLFGRHPVNSPHKGERARKSGFPPAPRNQTASSGAQLGSIQSPESRYRDKRPLSSAMSLLRGYYGLSSPAHQVTNGAEGMEMTSYRSDGEEHSEEEPFSPIAKPVSSDHINERKRNDDVKKEGSRLGASYNIRSEISPVMPIGDVEKLSTSEKSVRRRSKFDNAYPVNGSEGESRHDFGTPDRLPPNPFLSSGVDGSSTSNKIAGLMKVLDGPLLVGGKGKEVPILRVIKSLSTSNLQEQTILAVDPADPKYGSKADVKSTSQMTSSQVPTRSLFEGLSKPVGHRHKTALD